MFGLGGFCRFKSSILFLFIFSNEVKSKTNENVDFKANELSNYFSAVVSYGNQNNKKALKYFKFKNKILIDVWGHIKK